MACSTQTARRVTSRKLDATCTTSTPAWPRHRLRWSFTSGCFHCIPTASTQSRSGRLQKLRNRPAPTPGQPVTPDHGPDMSTIHLHSQPPRRPSSSSPGSPTSGRAARSVAPDASPLAGWMESTPCERSRPGCASCRSFQRARRVASSSFERNPRSAT